MKKTQEPAKKIRGVFEKVPGSGVWWIQYFDSAGRRRREKVGPKSAAKNQVEARRTDARAGVKMPENLRAKPITFDEIAKQALIYSRAYKRSWPKDVQRMKRLVKAFGSRPAESITKADFEGWLMAQHDGREGCEEKLWSQGTRNRYIALLKMTYTQAEKNDKIKVNPARKLSMPKENNERVRWLNEYAPDEESRLRGVIAREYPDRLADFEVALHTGMRRSEQYTATWPNVDMLNTKTIFIPQSKDGTGRRISLNSRVLIELERLLTKRREGNDLLFPDSGHYWFDRAVKLAGVPNFHWHDLRHTFASRLVQEGVDLYTVQRLLGHKDSKMTMRYAHLAPKGLQKAVERLVPTTEATATTGATDAVAIQ